MASNNNKSKYKGHYNHRVTNQPKRGGPGLLITCETGREKKAKQEVLDVLSYYSQQHDGENTTAHENKPNKTKEKLSLEQEIALLKKRSTKESIVGFNEYNTHCRGTVILIYTPEKGSNSSSFDAGSSAPETSKKRSVESVSEDPAPKKARAGDSSSTNVEQNVDNSTEGVHSKQELRRWDPVSLVRRMIKDRNSDKVEIPSSRFVSRVIPMESTCHASLKEITSTAKAVMKQMLPKDASTFAIAVKRRFNETLKRNDVIEAIAALLSGSKWKVNLKNPRWTIRVEICQDLCGVSVIENEAELHNFNLVEAALDGKK